MRSLAAAFMRFGLRRRGQPMIRRLVRESEDVVASQQRVLIDICSWASDSVYGREHGFRSITDANSFRSAVPVNTYEDLRPYVERHESGEADVLFPGKPMFYATTSGTTDAPKRIPITKKYHDECYNGLSNLWLASMFDENPGFMNGYDISMVGKAVEGFTADGTSYGSFSGHMNSYMPAFVKRFRVVPFGVHDMSHYPSKYYTILRVSLGFPIAWIVAANPSTLLELHRFAGAHYEELVRDIHNGTLRSDLQMEPTIRVEVESRLRPNRKRAAFLEKLVNVHSTVLPKHYWPTLQVINTWKSGNAGVYLRQAEHLYPSSTAIREFGYIATEARAGIVLRNNEETSILACHLLYFEFVHRSELDSANRTFLGAHEIQDGEEYGIFVTTPSGLYRYDMNDILRVEGFFGTFPRVRFVQKGAGVTSLTGEKLYESQYLEAVHRASRQGEVSHGFHIGFANLETSGYECFIEVPSLTSTELRAFSENVDAELCRINPEYDAKRKSGRLRPMVFAPLEEGAFLKYKSSRLDAGAREGQFKLSHLQQNNSHLELFRTLVCLPSTDGEQSTRSIERGNND